MLRPSTSRGRPALGCATSLAVPTSAMRSSVSSIAAGPTLQLRPITWTPNDSSTGVNCSGGVPSAVRPSSPVVTCATIGSSRDRAHATHRGTELAEIAERFEHEEVDAALGERLGLLTKRRFRLVEPGLAPGLDADAQRTDRARHVGLFARDVPGDLRTLPVDGTHAIGETERGQLDAIRAERVRLEDVGAGAEVLPVDLGHQVLLRQVQLVETAIEEDALRVEHRSHRPVADQDALVERFEKGLHGRRVRQTRTLSVRTARQVEARQRGIGGRAGPPCPR